LSAAGTTLITVVWRSCVRGVSQCPWEWSRRATGGGWFIYWERKKL